MARWFKKICGMVLIALLCSCDLFSTRPTEPPQDSGSPWIYPIQPQQVFLNLQQAFADLNSDHYLRCFFNPNDPGGTFLFVPNPNYAGWQLSAPWGYTEESLSIGQLFSRLTTAAPGFLMFEEISQQTYGNEDSIWVKQDYSLVVPLSDSTWTYPEDYTGAADFWLAKNGSGYWAIYRWEDLEGSPSWTELKAALY